MNQESSFINNIDGQDSSAEWRKLGLKERFGNLEENSELGRLIRDAFVLERDAQYSMWDAEQDAEQDAETIEEFNAAVQESEFASDKFEVCRVIYDQVGEDLEILTHEPFNLDLQFFKKTVGNIGQAALNEVGQHWDPLSETGRTIASLTVEVCVLLSNEAHLHFQELQAKILPSIEDFGRAEHNAHS